MNERINELRLDAGIGRLNEVPYLVAVNKEGENIDPLEGLQQFAELIIAECCVALHPMLRDMISRTQGVDLIVKHFGVEE